MKKTKKTLIGYAFKHEAKVDKLLRKDDCHISLDSAKIHVRKNQYENVYEDLNMNLPKSVKVKITIEVIK